MKSLQLSSTPVNKGDSYQTFLMYNDLCGKMNWNNEEHVNLLKQWNEKQTIFVGHQFMPISPNNSGYNH